jgi:hypothetical protein
LCDLPAERVGLDEVCERPLAVDLNDRKPLAVAGLELRVAADVDLLELERMPRTHGLEHAASTLAEVTAGRGEERDANGYG